MGREAYASLRLPDDLKREVKKIADDEHRPSLSNTFELLIRRGIEAYREDGMLVVSKTAARKRAPKRGRLDPASEKFANELVEKIIEGLRKEGVSK